MKFEDALLAIYSRLDTGMAATYPTMPVRYENRLTVDLATLDSPFVTCEVLFNDGSQASLGTTPLIRYLGAVYLSVWVKEGDGAAGALGTVGYLADLFKVTTFGGVNTHAPRPLPGRTQLGWYIATLRVPFWFDQQPGT